MTANSLFSGIGAFDLGFEQAGHTVLAQVEIDPNRRKLLKRHFPYTTLYENVKEAGAHNLPTADVVIGGFPCQDVSMAGKRKGLAGDRSGLWFEFHRVLRETRPRTVVVENVPGLLSSHAGKDFAAILQGLLELGYRAAWRTLDAQYFGVPQRRRRVFLVASLGDERCAEILFEPESLRRDPPPGRQTQQAAAGTLSASSGKRGADSAERNTLIPEVAHRLAAEAADASEDGTGRGQPLIVIQDAREVEKQQHGLGISEEEVSYTIDGRSRHAVAFPWNKPYPEANLPLEPTTSALQSDHSSHDAVVIPSPLGEGQGEGVNRQVLSTCVVRRLTPRECERLQGLPDDYTAGFSDSKRYEMIGDAVAVPVARWLGSRIKP